MDIFLALEFYYRSSNRQHLHALDLIKEALEHAAAAFSIREIDCDKEANHNCDLPALPCLRRLEPRPERLLVGPFRTVQDVEAMLGLPGKPVEDAQ